MASGISARETGACACPPEGGAGLGAQLRRLAHPQTGTKQEGAEKQGEELLQPRAMSSLLSGFLFLLIKHSLTENTLKSRARLWPFLSPHPPSASDTVAPTFPQTVICLMRCYKILFSFSFSSCSSHPPRPFNEIQDLVFQSGLLRRFHQFS